MLNEIARTKRLLRDWFRLFNIRGNATLPRAENRQATARPGGVGAHFRDRVLLRRGRGDGRVTLGACQTQEPQRKKLLYVNEDKGTNKPECAGNPKRNLNCGELTPGVAQRNATTTPKGAKKRTLPL